MENRLLFLATAIIFSIYLFSSHGAYAVTTITWDTGNGGAHSIFDGAINSFTTVQFTVTDTSLAGNGKTDKINVLVNSTSNPTGIILTLTEAGDTGTFTNTNLIFTNGTQLNAIPSSQTIGINKPSLVTDPTKIENIVSGPSSFDGIQVFSSTDTTGIFMNLTETGPGTGIFTNTLHFTAGPSINGSSISVSPGDIVSIQNINNLDFSDELVTPNPNADLGALPAKYGDRVDAVYNGVKQSVFLVAGSAPGGGGGGLVRPGLVLDVVAGLKGVFENIFHPPSIGNDYRNQFGGGITINGNPFDVKNYATKIQQQVLKIGQPAKFDFKIYDERGAYTVSHAGMYFHFKGDPAVTNTDTWISWDKYKGTDIHDPEKIFAKSSADVTTDGNFFHVVFTMTPQKTMPDSSLIMRMWDDKLSVGDVPIWGAIVIVDPNAPVPIKKIPTDQYGDYATLEKILDKDGYYIPSLLNKFHGIQDVYSSIDVNWFYDKGVDKLTMIESDKSENLVGTLLCNLTKKISQPKVTDHDYFTFTTKQLNRQDDGQEDWAKLKEAQKAVKVMESLGLLRQSNFGS